MIRHPVFYIDYAYRLPTVFKSIQKNVVIDRVERSAKIQEH